LKHQKIVPTIGERVVHTPGTTGHESTVHTQIGTISGLICGENSNPLYQYALALHYPVVHIASWPAHFGPALLMQEVVALVTRGLAYSLKCFVINSVAVVDDNLLEAYGTEPSVRAYLEDARQRGGASIIGPSGQIVAGPMAAGEGILYADICANDVIVPKFIHDFAGHYNRPELFTSLFGIDPATLTTIPRQNIAERRSKFLDSSENPTIIHDPMALLSHRGDF
jgi:nitrilase